MELVDTHSNNLGWLLDQQLGALPGVRGALLTSGDGLVQALTQGMTRETAEKLAGASAAHASTVNAMGREIGAGSVKQSLVEYDTCLLLSAAGGDNAVLMVVTDLDADVGAVTSRMKELSSRVGHAMGIAARRPDAEAERPSEAEAAGSPT